MSKTVALRATVFPLFAKNRWCERNDPPPSGEAQGLIPILQKFVYASMSLFGEDAYFNLLTFSLVRGGVILTTQPVFCIPSHTSIPHPSSKFQPNVISGQITRSGQVTLPKKYLVFRHDYNFLDIDTKLSRVEKCISTYKTCISEF